MVTDILTVVKTNKNNALDYIILLITLSSAITCRFIDILGLTIIIYYFFRWVGESHAPCQGSVYMYNYTEVVFWVGTFVYSNKVSPFRSYLVGVL